MGEAAGYPVGVFVEKVGSMSSKHSSLLVLILVLTISGAAQRADYTQFVDPFIGTKGTGHTFPGAAAPFGLVQPSPDTGDNGWAYTAGYQYADTSILGFSNTHFSGTGVPDLGDILLQPFTGEAIRESYKSGFNRSTESASPGSYSVVLRDFSVKVELTASERVAFHRFTFNADGSQRVLVDLQHGMVWADVRKRVIESDVKIVDDHTIAGYCEVENWVRRKYYFVITFDKPFARTDRLPARDFEKAPRFVLTFDGMRGGTVQAKVALSTVSVDGAFSNLKAEVPGWNFENVCAATRAKWNTLLSRIRVDADPDKKTIFYTALYHAFLQPSNITDVDGSYRGADDRVQKAKNGEYYSTLSLWDTFRATHQLYTLTVPERVDGMINTMLSHADATGFLPVWTLWGKETHTMIGIHSIPVITDAYAKGFRGFDAAKAFAAMKRSQTVKDKNAEWWDIYDQYGYLPFDKLTGNEAQTVSRTLEAGVDDFATAQMAKFVGQTQDEAFFLHRAGFYKNMFDPETKLMRGRDSVGHSRKPFDPLAPTSPLRDPGDYTEANAWQYSFASQHDIDGLIKLQGGKVNFAKMLDRFFSGKPDVAESDQHLKYLGQEGLIGQYSHGNEPSHHIAYLYKYTGVGWKTDELIRELTARFYSSKPDGITGNDDCGQMSAWYVLSVMGLYPVHPSNGEYVLGAPQVRSASIRLQNGKNFSIEARDLSVANKYVKQILLNGQSFDSISISHSDILKGGKLTFMMSDKAKI